MIGCNSKVSKNGNNQNNDSSNVETKNPKDVPFNKSEKDIKNDLASNNVTLTSSNSKDLSFVTFCFGDKSIKGFIPDSLVINKLEINNFNIDKTKELTVVNMFVDAEFNLETTATLYGGKYRSTGSFNVLYALKMNDSGTYSWEFDSIELNSSKLAAEKID
jgi:hypothetical protein